EVMRPASSNFGIIPVEEENFHLEVVRTAEQLYYRTLAATLVHVSVYFAKSRGIRRSKQGMARALAEYVRANVGRAKPLASSVGIETPEGFNTITIYAEPDPKPWWSGESGSYSVSDIRGQLVARVNAKNKLVPTYRANLGNGAA